jgi:hypothetical protein
MGELECESSCRLWSVLFVFVWRDLFCRCKVPGPYEPTSQFENATKPHQFLALVSWDEADSCMVGLSVHKPSTEGIPGR